MLEVVKQTISDLPDDSFGCFYQHYIMRIEDKILDYDAKRASSLFHSIEDVNDIIKNINKITEELK